MSDSANTLIMGSVPLGLTSTQDLSSVHIFRPSTFSSRWPPCFSTAFIISFTFSGATPIFVFAWKNFGSVLAMILENERPRAARHSSMSAVAIPPSLTAMCAG